MNEHLFHTCPSITKNLYHKHCGTFYQIFVYNLKNMTEKPSSLYILKRNIYLFVYSNNKSKLVSVTKGKGRDRKKRRTVYLKSHINIIVLIVRNYVHI